VSLIAVVVLLVVIGIILTLIQQAGLIQQPILNIIYAVVAVFMIVIVMRALGFWPGHMPDAKI
jgi:type III secretory pathway component EscS